MAIEQLDKTPRCQHVRLSGRRCKAPARRGGNYCLFHEKEHDTSPDLTFPPVEDAASVQVAADQVLQALRDNTIEFQRASLMFSGLRLMRANLKRLGLEMNDEVEEPTLAKSARVGHPGPGYKDEEEQGPGLAEYLILQMNEIEKELAGKQGRPPQLMDIAKAKAEGRNLSELILEQLEPPPGESGHPAIGSSEQQETST